MPTFCFLPRTPLLIFKENRRWPEDITASATLVVPPSFPAIYIYIYISATVLATGGVCGFESLPVWNNNGILVIWNTLDSLPNSSRILWTSHGLLRVEH